jgi:hypothetical protein
LVPNGDFPSGLSDGDVGYDNGDGTVDGWASANDAVLSVDANRLKVTNNVTNYGAAYHNLNLVSGKQYVVSFDLDLGTSIRCRIAVGTNSASENVLSGINITDNGSYAYTFTAAATNVLIFVNNDAADASYILLDNISVRLADPDRSVNGKGLGVHGTITKTAVATGADVVAYSGFSSSNYLEQPYNADLDFGTGDFSMMGWVEGFRSSFNCFLHRTSDKSSSSGLRFMDDGSGQILVTGYGGNLTGGVYPTNDWFHVCFVRKDDVGYIYLNGTLANSGAWAASVTDVDATLALGGYWTSNALLANSPPLALWRISGTAPTADQIRKIYEDEKVLFQPNAKATLTGNSDAVTALAYDPDTNLLHVGTPGGRSVFQGLRRVEEHTGTNSQSLAAISAVDGLVVEGK